MDEGSMHAKYFWDRPSHLGEKWVQTNRHTNNLVIWSSDAPGLDQQKKSYRQKSRIRTDKRTDKKTDNKDSDL